MRKIISLILTVMLVVAVPALVPTSASAEEVPDKTIVIKDVNLWESFYYYGWYEGGARYGENINDMDWPGTKLEPVAREDGYNLYEISIPDYSEYTYIIVNNGEGEQSQTLWVGFNIYGYTITVVRDKNADFRAEELVPDMLHEDPRAIRNLYMAHFPDKTDYELGETFDPTGMELYLRYYSGRMEKTDNYTIENFRTERSGTYYVSVIYTTETGERFYSGFHITVHADVVRMELTRLPFESSCIVGGKFNLQGLEVNLVLEDGTKKKLSMLPGPNTPKTVLISNNTGWDEIYAVVLDKDGTEATYRTADVGTSPYGEELYSFALPTTTQSFYLTDGGAHRTNVVDDLDADYYFDYDPSENGEWKLLIVPGGLNPQYENEEEPDGYTLSPLERKAGRQTVTVTYHEYTADFEIDVFDKGDVNRDFIRNIVDVTAIQRKAAELTTFDDFEKQLADMNNDGRNDVADATLLQLTIAGLQ